MSKEDTITVEGTVIEPLPNTEFKIELINGRVVTGKLAGKMQMNFIRILPGDRVTVEFSPYNLDYGRIIYRNK